ncbi:MAG: glycosyltransferase family 39 protein [Chloroflexota bacterium]
MSIATGAQQKSLASITVWFREHWLELILLLIILVAALGLRLYRLDGAPPGLQHDEVFQAIFAMEILAGARPVFFEANGGESALYAYFVALAMRLLGESYLAIRLVSVFFGMWSLLAGYLLCRELWGRWVALLATGGLAVSFWHVFDSRVGLTPISMLALALTSFCFFWWGLRRKNALLLAVSGLFLGGSLYTYLSAPVIPVALFLFVVYLVFCQRQLLRDNAFGLLLLFVIAVAVAVPLARFIATHPATSTARVRDLSVDLAALAQGDPAPILADTLGVLGMFTFRGDPKWRYNIAGRTVFDPVTGLLFYIGLALAIVRWKRPEYAFLLVWTAVLTLPSALSPENPSTLRSLGAITAIYSFPAIALAGLWKLASPRVGPGAGSLVLAGAALLMGVSGFSTYRDYFVVWVKSPEVREVYRADLAEAAHYLDRAALERPAFVSATYFSDLDQQSLQLMAGKRHRLRWYDGKRSAVLPASPVGQAATYVLPATGMPPPDLLGRYYQRMRVVHRGLDPQGNTAFVVYQAGPEVIEGLRRVEPERPMALRSQNDIEFLGVDLPGRVAAGERANLTLYWRISAKARWSDADPPLIFVYLLDNGGYRWAEENYLALMPSQWEYGDVVISRLQPLLPADAPPRPYRVALGMKTLKGTHFMLREAGGEPVGLQAVAGVIQGERKGGPPAGFQPPIQFPIEANYGDQIQLIGVAAKEKLNPGDTLRLSAFWRCTAPVPRDYVLRLRMVRPGGEILRELEETLLKDEYPTSRWRPGELLRTYHDLPIPVDAKPDKGLLQLTLLDDDLKGLVPGRTPNVLGWEITGRPHVFTPPRPQNPLARDLADGVRFLGYDVAPTTVRPGEPISVTLYWQALETPSRSYTVFVHLLDGQNRLWGQEDALPGHGLFPTNTWVPGEFLADRFEFKVDPDAPAGDYIIEAGMYDYLTGRRLPVLDGQGRLGDDRLAFKPVQVRR